MFSNEKQTQCHILSTVDNNSYIDGVVCVTGPATNLPSSVINTRQKLILIPSFLRKSKEQVFPQSNIDD